MSRLEELIQELCPDGVKYKKISDITPATVEYEQSHKLSAYNPLERQNDKLVERAGLTQLRN